MNLQAYMGEHTPKRKIVLHGYLGEKYGKEFDLAVRSPVEAIKLLTANFPSFPETIKKGTWQIVVGTAKAGIQCSLELCHFLFPKGEIHIIPVPEGSGGGGSKSKGIILSIIGVALIATAFVGAAFLSGAATIGAGLGTSAFMGVTWGQIGLLGAALLLMGVAVLLTPTPKPDAQAGQSFPSFFYSGAVQSDREGGCVPIVYGRCWAGSVVVAGGLFNDQYSISSAPVVYSSFTIADSQGLWITEGTNYGGVDNDPNKLDADSTPAHINSFAQIGSYTRAEPPAPVGGTTTR